MYSIKIMSGENLPDADCGKGFKIFLVDSSTPFQFGHCEETGEPYVEIWNKDSSAQHSLMGNAYVMNAEGKTIASFWARRKTVQVTLEPKDTNPTVTVSNLKELYNNISLPKSWIEAELNRQQIDLLLNGPTVLPRNANEREKAHRARVGYLTSQGIPTEIAMESCQYMLN